jgi:hypothetical protein
MTEVRCNGCRTWFDAKRHVCECGHARPGYNKFLRTAQLNNNLYKAAESADREAKYARANGLG